MATSRIIEEERGTYTGHIHPHNGYWAGDFSAVPIASPTRPTQLSWAPASHARKSHR
jgi:hypothetical protein